MFIVKSYIIYGKFIQILYQHFLLLESQIFVKLEWGDRIINIGVVMDIV